jgi:hypothetical protein
MIRKAPLESATKRKVNDIEYGNDGNKYIIVQYGNIKKWKLHEVIPLKVIYEVRLKLYITRMIYDDLEDLQYRYKKATQKEFDESFKPMKITKRQLTDYMNTESRADEYFNSLGFPYNFVNCRCEDGVLKAYYIQNPNDKKRSFTTQLDMHTDLLESSLEDGAYNGGPGNCAIYPTLNGKFDYGYIDFRKKENIRIKLIKEL